MQLIFPLLVMLEEQSDHIRTLLHHDPMILKMPYIYKLICEKRLYFFYWLACVIETTHQFLVWIN